MKNNQVDEDKCPKDGKEHNWLNYLNSYLICAKCEIVKRIEKSISSSFTGIHVIYPTPETFTNERVTTLLSQLMDETIKAEATHKLSIKQIMDLNEIRVKLVEYKENPINLIDTVKSLDKASPFELSESINNKLSTDEIPIKLDFIDKGKISNFEL